MLQPVLYPLAIEAALGKSAAQGRLFYCTATGGFYEHAIALNECEDSIEEYRNIYRSRRDTLIAGLARAGWEVPAPRATMFVWAEIPEPHRSGGSLEFTKLLLREAKVAVSPGVGFGVAGDQHVRFALVENEHRIRQATRGIKRALGT